MEKDFFRQARKTILGWVESRVIPTQAPIMKINLSSIQRKINFEKIPKMSKLFAVVVATVPEYYEYKKDHPEHDQDQVAWFKEQYANGNLLCCGPFFPHDGTGVWILQAEDLDKAWSIVNTSPRARDGMLSDTARVVEWQVHIGRNCFIDE